MEPVLTLDELLDHRRAMVVRWALGFGALAVLLVPIVVVLVVVPFDDPRWLLLGAVLLGTPLLLGVLVLPFVEADRRRSARVAREIVAEGAARGTPPAAAAEVVVAAGRPGEITWAGRVVGVVAGPGFSRVVPHGEEVGPPRRRISRGGDQYRWMRLDLQGRRYVLMGMTGLHLVDDTGRCWPLVRASKVDTAFPLRRALPADLDGGDVVTVLQAVVEFEARVRANQEALSSLS